MKRLECSGSDSEGSGNGNDNNGSGPQDISQGSDSSSDGSGDDGVNNDDNVLDQNDERNLVDDDPDEAEDKEPPTSTERGGGNPLEGLNLRKLEKEKADCDKYLKSLGGGDETSVGDTIQDPFKTKEEYCRGLLGGAPGINIRNGTTLNGPASTGPINNSGAT